MFISTYLKFLGHQRMLSIYTIKEQFISGNTVTVMSPEGKPIQMNAMALQAAAAQNAAGMLGRIYIDNCMKYFIMKIYRFR